MSDDRQNAVGLSRRALEREMQWLMRHPPVDPLQLARLMGQVVITLIDKNNTALAEKVAPHDDGKPGAP